MGGQVLYLSSTRRKPHLHNLDHRLERGLHQNQQAEFKKGTMIYTDSSGYKDQVAALVILFTNGRRTAELCYRLRPLTEHTVLEGELVGIIMGLHLACSINGTCT